MKMRKNVCGKRKLAKQVLIGLFLGGVGALTTLANVAAAAPTASDAMTEYALDDIIVTASRTEKREVDTPAATEIVTAADMERLGAANSYEAMERLPGFNSLSWGESGQEFGLSASRTIVRGLDKGTLAMVNGASVNLLNYNSTNNILPEAIQRIEVVKGASSALYGAAAIGGAVNVITKRGSDFTTTKLAASYGNYNRDYTISTGNGQFGLIFKRYFIGELDRTSLNGLTNIKTNAAILPWGLNSSGRNAFYITADLGKNLNLNWSYNDMYLHRIRYNVNGTHSVDFHYRDTRNNINLEYKDAALGLRSVLAYNKRRAYADKYTFSSKKYEISERYSMDGLTWDTQKEWKIRDGKDDFILGFTFSRESAYGLITSDKTLWINTHRTSESLYASYAWQAVPRFTMTLGLRGEHISDYSKTQNIFLPQFQTNYKFDDNSSWYINIGKAYEVAPINQFFEKKGGDVGQVKAQQGWTYETGYKYVGRRDSFKAALYHMSIKDAFKWKKTPANTDYLSNVDDFRNTGIEMEYDHRVDDHWSFNFGLSFSNPQNRSDGGGWTQANSRFQGIAGVSYAKGKFVGNVNWLYLGDREEDYYKINGVLGDVPNFSQLNANFVYRPDQNQTLRLKINNILDREDSVNKWNNILLPVNYLLSYEYSF